MWLNLASITLSYVSVFELSLSILDAVRLAASYFISLNLLSLTC